jgi:ATP phosphoribosyltransferase
VIPHTEKEISWHAVNIIVRKDRISAAVNQLRAIGGSGVIVTPVTYIFEEEPERYKAMLEALQS